jgi:hypothetical protein
MSLLEEVQSNEYKSRIEQAYYLTLVDIIMGVALEEIEDEIYVYEQDEMYEYCAGILRALEFSENKTYSEIQKEILTLKHKYE